MSLAYRIRSEQKYNKYSLLILDKSAKNINDRTWCFWSNKAGIFEDIVHHSWSTLDYKTTDFVKEMNITPYSYKMIRGLDFYKYVFQFLDTQPNTFFSQETILEISESDTKGYVKTTESEFEGSYIFQSYPEKLDTINDHFVWQHFKGWVIKSPSPIFNPSRAIFMDFRINQEDDTRFFYVLPTSQTEALVELAIFSDKIPASNYYDSYLSRYLTKQIGINNWEVLHEEVGAIPMTAYDFQKTPTNRIVKIGTHGGAVKASSGYAFTRIQKQIDMIMSQLDSRKFKFPKKTRYDLYDNILLNAILTGKTSGKEVFDGLFKKLSAQTIFKFLDGEGSFLTDLKVFTGPPTLPFVKALLDEIS